MFCSFPFTFLFKQFDYYDAVLARQILDRFPRVPPRVAAPLNVIPRNSGPEMRQISNSTPKHRNEKDKNRNMRVACIAENCMNIIKQLRVWRSLPEMRCQNLVHEVRSLSFERISDIHWCPLVPSIHSLSPHAAFVYRLLPGICFRPAHFNNSSSLKYYSRICCVWVI